MIDAIIDVTNVGRMHVYAGNAAAEYHSGRTDYIE